jgi:hypothetical protein
MAKRLTFFGVIVRMIGDEQSDLLVTGGNYKLDLVV